MEIINQLLGKELPQSIQIPFKLEYITQINMTIEESWFTKGKFMVHGFVEFKNKDTTGTQNFTANNLSELYIKIQKFCESLR